MDQPKLRIIAGPNGSGKTTFLQDVKKNGYFYLHNYINADDIQKELDETKMYSLNRYTFVTTKEQFDAFVSNSTFSEKIEESIFDIVAFENNGISLISDKSNSYVAALIADFIRHQLLENNQSFEFETVMSHQSKIALLQQAKEKGYKVYLYFLCTESPQINKINVKNRVKQGGHYVEENKIESRFYKTLSLLKDAVDSVDVAFVLQNNLIDFTTIYVVKNKEVIEESIEIPNWFKHYYLDKK
jgi:predicted ABC-type ATPase